MKLLFSLMFLQGLLITYIEECIPERNNTGYENHIRYVILHSKDFITENFQF